MPTPPEVFSFHGCSVQSSISQQTQTSYPCSCYCHYWKWFVCIAKSPWTTPLFIERMGRELRLYWDPCTCQTLCEEFFLHSCLIFYIRDWHVFCCFIPSYVIFLVCFSKCYLLKICIIKMCFLQIHRENIDSQLSTFNSAQSCSVFYNNVSVNYYDVITVIYLRMRSLKKFFLSA